MSRLLRASIDIGAMRSNLERIRTLAPRSRVMAIVKANAYGHGVHAAVRALAKADAFGVARLEEALALRAVGVEVPIVLLEGVVSEGQQREAAAAGLDLVVHVPEQIAWLEGSRNAERLHCWFKLDSGMNRLGFNPEEADAALVRLERANPASIRLMTHLAKAEESSGAGTALQLGRFKAFAADRGYERSVANSAAIFASDSTHADWVRPGLALYGASPFPDRSAASLGLVPAMTVESEVIAVRTVREGESVGYGGSWTATRTSRIAIVGAGYGDGLLRSLASGSPVSVRGRRAPIVGRISMDMCAVDVTDVTGVALGTLVQFWGRDLPIETVAPCAATIPYELLCSIQQRSAELITH